jgi:hypothetical protein
LKIKHRKKDLSNNKYGECSCEKKLPIEFFCRDCKKCLCSNERFFGEHSELFLNYNNSGGKKELEKSHDIVEIEIAKKEYFYENNEVCKQLKNEQEKLKSYISKLFEISDGLRKDSDNIKEKILVENYGKETHEVNDKCNNKLKLYLSSINQLQCHKDNCEFFNEKLKEKEEYVKNYNKIEFIWLWNIRKKMIDNILKENMKDLMDNMNFKDPEKKEHESDTKTTVSTIEFVIENNIIYNDNANKEKKNRTDDKKPK